MDVLVLMAIWALMALLVLALAFAVGVLLYVLGLWVGIFCAGMPCVGAWRVGAGALHFAWRDGLAKVHQSLMPGPVLPTVLALVQACPAAPLFA